MVKNILYTALICIFLFLSTESSAQDFIYTQYDLAPTLYNPAKTGDYYGNLRVGGIYRDRTITITRNRLQTPSFYVDSPLFKGFRKGDWIGLGGTILQDQAGSGELVTQEMRLSLAYHLSVGSGNVFSIGLHGGTYSRSFNMAEKFRFEDEILQGISSPDKNGLVTNNDSKFSMGAGIQFSGEPSKQVSFKTGLSVTHFFFYNYSLTNTTEVKIPLMFIAHAVLDYKINNKLSVQPMILAQIRKGGYNIAAMSYLSYKLDPQSDFYLQPGIGYRVHDAALVMFGVGWKSLKVRAAYDLTLSSFLRPSQTVGALEFGAMYVIKFNKAPEVEKAIICPRL